MQDKKTASEWTAVISNESVYKSIFVSATGKVYSITSKNPNNVVQYTTVAAALTAMGITGITYNSSTGWPTTGGVFTTAPLQLQRQLRIWARTEKMRATFVWRTLAAAIS